MLETRGILRLSDPLGADGQLQRQKRINESTLVFNENERYLSQAQAALWEMRRRFNWVCVAGRGRAACIAVALAAQLPVDRLALADFRLFSPGKEKLPRELARLKTYARRNISLVVSQILIGETDEAELRRLVRALGNRDICALDKWDGEMLAAPWPLLQEKNLLIPWNCV